jgi:hypothetical protein
MGFSWVEAAGSEFPPGLLQKTHKSFPPAETFCSMKQALGSFSLKLFKL